MKTFPVRILLCSIGFLLCAVFANAQAGAPGTSNYPASVLAQSGAPAGNCTATNVFVVNTANGNLYTCPVVGSPYTLAGGSALPTGLTFAVPTLTVSTAGSGNGCVALSGNTSGTATICAPAVAGTSANPSAYSNVSGLPDGTAGNPAYGFTSDAGLGWYKAAAGQIAAATDGGNVGIRILTAQTVIPGNAAFCFASGTNNATNACQTGIWQPVLKLVTFGSSTANSTTTFIKSANTVIVTATDVTCGTGGTIADCSAAITIPGLSFTLPLLATNYAMDCDLIVSQATAPTANQWLIQTASNGVTNTTASYMMSTAATAMAVGAVTDQPSTTTAFQLSPSWTLGGTGTKMPVHIHASFEGVSVSGTVINLQVLAPTVADLLTIYRGAKCSLNP